MPGWNTISRRGSGRAEAIVLHAAGWEAAESARALEVHVNPGYADLQAFAPFGGASVRQCLRGGAPVRISPQQTVESLRLAETPPGDGGLPYGRWSLAKLREDLFRRRVVRTIRREHLRRVLRKGGHFQRVERKLVSHDPPCRAILAHIRGSWCHLPRRGVLLFCDVQPIPVKAYGGHHSTSARRLMLEKAQKTP